MSFLEKLGLLIFVFWSTFAAFLATTGTLLREKADARFIFALLLMSLGAALFLLDNKGVK